MTLGGGVKDAGADMMRTVDLSAIGDNELARAALTPMGVTSEIVAERYGVCVMFG